MTVTDPIGSTWYRGQVSFGAELLAFGTYEPLASYGIGITMKLQYTFVCLDRLRPTSRVLKKSASMRRPLLGLFGLFRLFG